MDRPPPRPDRPSGEWRRALLAWWHGKLTPNQRNGIAVGLVLVVGAGIFGISQVAGGTHADTSALCRAKGELASAIHDASQHTRTAEEIEGTLRDAELDFAIAAEDYRQEDSSGAAALDRLSTDVAKVRVAILSGQPGTVQSLVAAMAFDLRLSPQPVC